MDKNNKHVAISSKSFTDFLNKSKGQVRFLPQIAEHPRAIHTFTFFPPNLGPLEINDKNGILLGSRSKIGQGLPKEPHSCP